MFYWLMSKDRLRKQQENSNKQGLAIVITLHSEHEAKQLDINDLRFGGAMKKLEKYQKAGLGSICFKCCEISYERLESCRDKLEMCIMCVGSHQASKHKCRVNRCNKRRGKLCIHIVAQCANYQGNHQVSSTRCVLWMKAEIKACKKKIAKIFEISKKAKPAIEDGKEQKDATICKKYKNRGKW